MPVAEKLQRGWNQSTHKAVVIRGERINVLETADRMGVDPLYLRKVLSGNRTPSLDYVKKLADILDMSIDTLLTEITKRRSA